MKLISKCCGAEVSVNESIIITPMNGEPHPACYCTKCGLPCDTIEQDEKEEVEDGACSFCGNNTFYQKEKGTKGDWYCDNCNTFKCTNEQFEKSALKEMIKTPAPNDWIENKMKEFDNNQRRFLGGLLHSTQFNKWFKEVLTQQKEAIEKDWREKSITLLQTAILSCEGHKKISGDTYRAIVEKYNQLLH